MDLRIDGCVYIENVNGFKNFLHILQDGIVNVARNGQVHGVGGRIIRCLDGLCAVYFTQPKGGELVSCGAADAEGFAVLVRVGISDLGQELA